MVTVVDVVSHQFLVRAVARGSATDERGVSPVLIERHVASDNHCKDASQRRRKLGAGETDDPVAVSRLFPNIRFAAGQAAKSVEWIRRKTEVVADGVEIEAHRPRPSNCCAAASPQ